MKQLRVGIVGIGAVGVEMVRVLRQRNFPAAEIRILARSERKERIDHETFQVFETQPESFEGLDLALFCGTEGSKGASRLFAWEAARRGCVVIDNGDDFRMDDRVPLVIPEVNAEALDAHQGVIANPNCSTIIALMALAPLHRDIPMRRIVAATYQSVSGTGRAAIDELDRQTRNYVERETPAPDAYPHPIAFNVLPQIGGESPALPGFTSEEAKLLFESRKILGAPDLRVCSTCVRVPVFYSHAEALHVEFSAPMSVARARELLTNAPGVRVTDDLVSASYPMPLTTQHQDMVEVGRLRLDPSCENGLALFVAGDNLRKGAALNAVQIAEALMARDRLGVPPSSSL